MRSEPKTLREAYVLYRENKYLRGDMIGRIVTEIEALQARIGAVDEAAVASLDNRVCSIETVIGNALTAAGSAVEVAPAPPCRGRPPKQPDASVNGEAA